MLKRLTVIVILAATAWSAWWWWSSRALRTDVEGWFSERREEGWQAEYGDFVIRGFPNRHDLIWTDLQIVDPHSGIGWVAPSFRLYLLSYNTHHAIAQWPASQDILTPDGTFTVRSEGLQASLVTTGDTRALMRANAAADVLNVTDPEGHTTALGSLRAALSRQEVDITRYDVALELDGLALSTPFLRAAGDAIPQTFQETRVKATVGFDEALELDGLAGDRPQANWLDLDLARFLWGPMELRFAGQMKADDTGWIEGDLDIRAENWRDMLRVARASGQIPTAALDGLDALLSTITTLSGSGDKIDVGLRFDDRRTFVGPLPVAPAPRLARD